jgi:N-acyl-D-aspartate/D-glutamate deacylase
MRRLSAAIGRPVTFALTQNDHDPESWRKMLQLAGDARAEGARVRPQVAGRPVTLLLGLETFHPFAYCPSWGELGLLSVADRVGRLRANPDLRARLVAEASHPDPAMLQFLDPSKAYPLGDPPNYEPAPEASIAAEAARTGRDPFEVLYDRMLELDGRQLLMLAILSYSDGDLEALRELLEHPASAFGLGDGGAHCGAICDASMTTFLLTHWARDRSRGPKLPIEWVVRKMTRDTAWLYGLRDRGVVAPGLKADLNVIDYKQIQREDIDKLSTETVLVVAIARLKERSMIFAELTALAVHKLEKILAGISNPPYLNEQGSNPPRDGVQLGIPDFDLDYLKKFAARFALGEGSNQLKDYLKHVHSP